jgi:LysR family cyn operon transcriptional activator
MELRQLRYFVKVAELKNFSESARQLNITQSNLSQQIRLLEGELGVELFIRDSHHVRLTDIGQAFLPRAEHAITAVNTCIDSIHDVMQLDTGELHLGSTYSFLPLLKETVMQFMKQYPGIKLKISCHSMETLLNMLQEERIDVALSYNPLGVYPNISSHILFDNKLAVIVSDTHPLANQPKISLKDIERFPLAMPASGFQARKAFDRIIEGTEYNFDIRLEINEVNVLINLVRASNSLVTVLSQAALAGMPGIQAIPLDHDGTDMKGSFHVLKDSYMKRATKEFLRMLCENRSYGMALMNIL